MNVQVLAVEEKQCALSTATFKYLAIEYGSSDERGRRIQGDHSASSSSIIITESYFMRHHVPASHERPW